MAPAGDGRHREFAMPITTRIDEGIMITPPAQLTGEVARYFRQEMLAMIPDHTGKLAVDLSHVTAIDADGLSVLVSLHDALSPQALIVVEPSPIMQTELERVRLFELFDIYYQRDPLLVPDAHAPGSSREVA